MDQYHISQLDDLLICTTSLVKFAERGEVFVSPSIPEVVEDMGVRRKTSPKIRCTCVVGIKGVIVVGVWQGGYSSAIKKMGRRERFFIRDVT